MGCSSRSCPLGHFLSAKVFSTARLNSNKFDEFFGAEETLAGELHLNNFQNEETRLFNRKVLEQAAQDERRKGNLVLNSHLK